MYLLEVVPVRPVYKVPRPTCVHIEDSLRPTLRCRERPYAAVAFFEAICPVINLIHLPQKFRSIYTLRE